MVLRQTVNGNFNLTPTVSVSLEFGFEQSVLVGREQGAVYSINMGFLEGRHDQQIQVTVQRILETAGKSWNQHPEIRKV